MKNVQTLSKTLAAPALLVLSAFTGLAQAQAPAPTMSAAEAQMRYERRLAECNVGTLAAPDRSTCVRTAGQIFDSERAGQQTPQPVTTYDRRATVIRNPPVPAGVGASPDAATTGVTSSDGRATIIAPIALPQ